jgi:hypothetical protein
MINIIVEFYVVNVSNTLHQCLGLTSNNHIMITATIDSCKVLTNIYLHFVLVCPAHREIRNKKKFHNNIDQNQRV